ncbi:MAG: hypothetical protein ACI3W6_09245 [Clostridia bacterium]
MKIGKIDLKNEFSAVKNKVKKAVPGKNSGRKKEKQNRPRPKFSAPPASGEPRRPVVFHVPVGVQTVIAVLVCCGVLFTAGFAVFTVEQMEINSLKKDLKAYADDGVVPAGSMDSSVSLNIESVAGRVAALQKMIDGASDGTLSNDKLQWIGTELDEVSVESQILSEILDDVEADKTAKMAYKDTVQSPLVSLQQSYDALQVQDDDVADTAVESGAATDTGAFKSSGGMGTETKWGIAVVVLILLILGVLAFLFRRKIAAFFAKGKKTGKSPGKRNEKIRPGSNPQGKSSPSSAGKERVKKETPVKPERKNAAEAEPATEKPVSEPAEAVSAAEESVAETDENEAFLEELAPALRKLAEKERQKAEDGSGMIEPSKEDLLTFDDSVVTQDAIEEDEDSLFTKKGDDSAKGKEEQ